MYLPYKTHPISMLILRPPALLSFLLKMSLVNLHLVSSKLRAKRCLPNFNRYREGAISP